MAVSTPIDETRLNQLAAAEPDSEHLIVTVPIAGVVTCAVERA